MNILLYRILLAGASLCGTTTFVFGIIEENQSTAIIPYQSTTLIESVDAQKIINESILRECFRKQITQCNGDNEKIAEVIQNRNNQSNNEPNNQNNTPHNQVLGETWLMIAASKGYAKLASDVIQAHEIAPELLLLQKNVLMQNPLVIAIINKNHTIMEQIISFASQNSNLLIYLMLEPDTQKKSAFSYAFEKRSTEIILLLLNYIQLLSDEDTLNFVLSQSIVLAAEKGLTEVVVKILNIYNQQRNLINKEFLMQALNMALLLARPQIASAIIEFSRQIPELARAIIDYENMQGDTCFILAAYSNMVNVMKMLVELCRESNISVKMLLEQVNGENANALHVAAEFGATQSARFLIDLTRSEIQS